MDRRSRRSDWSWVGRLLNPAAAAAVGAVVALVATAAVIYPLALHDWGNEARNIATVADFYETAGTVEAPDGLAEATSARQPSEYLRVVVDTLVFDPADPAADCRLHLRGALHPDHAAAEGEDADTAAIEAVCVDGQMAIGRFGSPDMLVAAIPVLAADGRLVGVRVQRTMPTAKPSLLAAILERRALLALGVVMVLSAVVGFLIGMVARAHLDSLRRVAMIDGLTGCLRREAFLDAADHALRRARRSGRPLSMLVIDVDRLKQINDRFGHAGGDAALSLVSSSMRSALRNSDFIGRIGGDEFAAVLPEAGIDEAAAIAERARAGIGVVHLALGGEQAALSVSIGLAELEDGETAEALIARADSKLYGAKFTRNAIRS